MRFFERALRRAELPVRLTGGFNPRPRMVFLCPEPGRVFGVEQVELEFAEPVSPNLVREKPDASCSRECA